MSPFGVRELIVKGSGTEFDPEVVDAFLAVFRRGEMEVPFVPCKSPATQSSFLSLYPARDFALEFGAQSQVEASIAWSPGWLFPRPHATSRA